MKVRLLYFLIFYVIFAHMLCKEIYIKELCRYVIEVFVLQLYWTILYIDSGLFLFGPKETTLMKKKILAFLVLLLVSVAVFAFADSDAVENKEQKWGVYGGTSYLVSHVGASYNMGRLEFSGTLYSGFPNIAIIGYTEGMKTYNNLTPEEKKTADKPKFSDYMLSAFQLAYMGNVSALFDLTGGEVFHFLIGASLSGAYSNLGALLSTSTKINIGVVALDAVMKIQFNFAKHSGIYIASELPLGGILFTPNSDDSSKTAAVPFTLGLDGYLTAAATLLVYTTRVGYVYRF